MGVAQGRLVEGTVPHLVPRQIRHTSPGGTHSICTASSGIRGESPSKVVQQQPPRVLHKLSRRADAEIFPKWDSPRSKRTLRRANGTTLSSSRSRSGEGLPRRPTRISSRRCPRNAAARRSGWTDSGLLGAGRAACARLMRRTPTRSWMPLDASSVRTSRASRSTAGGRDICVGGYFTPAHGRRARPRSSTRVTAEHRRPSRAS